MDGSHQQVTELPGNQGKRAGKKRALPLMHDCNNNYTIEGVLSIYYFICIMIKENLFNWKIGFPTIDSNYTHPNRFWWGVSYLWSTSHICRANI